MASQSLIAAGTSTPDPSELAMLNAGYGLQTAADSGSVFAPAGTGQMGRALMSGSNDAQLKPKFIEAGLPVASYGQALTQDNGGRFTASLPRSPGDSASKYGKFDAYYENWSKVHKGAPRYIPASQWNPYSPIPARMTSESQCGPYNMITFHHTGSEDTPMSVANFDRGKENLLHFLGREIANGFKAERYDNGDLSYHFLIGKDGTIYGGRSLDYEGAHVYGRNPKNICVAFIGDYSSQPLSDAQVYAAKSLIYALNDAYGVYNQAEGEPYVFTHRDLAPATGPHARPTELLGAQRQMNAVKAWSINTLPARH